MSWDFVFFINSALLGVGLTLGTLLIQGVATSIDALSVGLKIGKRSELNWPVKPIYWVELY